MAGKNKILSSKHHREIHERLANGEGFNEVSEWLEKTYGEKISPRTMRRYYDNYINIKTKIQARYNKRKAQQKKQEIVEDKIVDSKVKDKFAVEQITDEYTESVVDALDIIDYWIPELSNNLEIGDLTPNQKSQLLVKMLDLKLKYTIGPSEEEGEFNILDVFKAEIKVIK